MIKITNVREIKIELMNLLYKRKYIKLLKHNSGRRILLLGTPLHGNLGDQAISEAELTFLHDNFSDIPVIEIPRFYYQLFEKEIQKYIRDTDIILIHGGGFLGNLWPGEQKFVESVINHFKKVPIIIMPQTIYFTSDNNSEEQIERSKIIFNKHEKLFIFLREKYSFEVAQKLYHKANLFLVPDIVLYLCNRIKLDEKKRNGILLCFRKDKEKALLNCQIREIENIVKELGQSIEYIDTVVKHNIFPQNRKNEVLCLLKKISSARLMVTDRLHGMIFAAITKTPCIVLNNNNYKIKGVYQWINEINNIVFIEDLEELSEALTKLFLSEDKCKAIYFENDFSDLKIILKELLEESC